MKASNKVALNTAILYGRMVITVGMTLYTTRLLLSALGSVDYGIFSVIAGVVFILSFLNTAMATSTQRFLSFYEGKQDLLMQRKVFANSLWLHIFLGVIIVVGIELSGLFLFDSFLNIPSGRMEASKVVFHFLSVSVFFTILSAPFNGSLIAHENMLWVAIVNIVENVLRLLVALLLWHVDSDKLILYGAMTALIAFILFLLYALYCFWNYQECKLGRQLHADRKLIKELGLNAGWNLFGVLSGMGKNQGMALLLNVFFGPTINASFAIANQVSGQLNFFSGTMMRALNPQIMKSEGDGNRQRMIKLSLFACKMAFVLLCFVSLPCMFEMPTILGLWLKDVPDQAAELCIFILLGFMLNQITIGLDSAAQATGNLKQFMLFVGTSKLLIIPAGFLVLKSGLGLYPVFIAYVLLEGLSSACRIYVVNKLVNLTFFDFWDQVLRPLLIPLVLTLGVSYAISNLYAGQNRLFITFPASSIVFGLSLYIWGLSSAERALFKTMSAKFTGRLKLASNKNTV